MHQIILKRILAFLFDCILIFIFSYLTARVLQILNNKELVITINLFYFFIYFILSLWKFEGKTLGLALLKIKVISLKSSKISIWLAFIRTGMILAYLFSFIFVGLVIKNILFYPTNFFKILLSPTCVLFIIFLNCLIGSTLTLFFSPTKEKLQMFWDVAASTSVIQET
jgi:uncharacterized RDD family membrane protein YckC